MYFTGVIYQSHVPTSSSYKVLVKFHYWHIFRPAQTSGVTMHP